MAGVSANTLENSDSAENVKEKGVNAATLVHSKQEAPMQAPLHGIWGGG